jgi:tetratricopeptide (TPR) repeat protein
MMQNKPGRDKSFVCAKLPWIIAAAALILYLVTLNRWISLNNLNAVGKSAGWLWGPEVLNPIYYLLTYPIHWVPVEWVPLAFNLISLGCAVLTLALLARSVALLPHDRTEAQRLREHNRKALLSVNLAWIPPLLAAMVCGLQLTFWEKGTSGSADMLDLLLFAYVVRCLLEYRISSKDSWLWQAVLVWSVGMANGWLMCCLLPFFVLSMIWIKGLAFFKLRFLFRIFICAVVGLLFYLVLPMVQVLSHDHAYTFWETLKSNLASDKNVLMLFATRVPRPVLLMLAVTSLLPVIVMGIRWASNFGDPSRVGTALTRWIFHLAHGALFATGIWVAFDPTFSPRYNGYAILALYYLASLSVGYFAGYFLLVFNPLSERMGRTSQWEIWLNRFSKTCVCLLLVIVPAGLIFKNFPDIRVTNGRALKQYTFLLLQNLPDHGILLSDDARKLVLVEAALARIGKDTDYIFLDTQMLHWLGYHTYQHRQHPKDWPAEIPRNSKQPNTVDDAILLNLMMKLSESRPVYYLHPSFGYYFEFFGERQHGLICELSRYPTNSLSALPLSDAEIAQNETFWTANDPNFDHLIPFISRPPLSTNMVMQPLLDMFHIPFQPNITAATLGQFYSRDLNYWAVQLQKSGKLNEAQRHFRTALALNPDNIAAKYNLDLNRELHAGKPLTLRMPRSVEEEIGQFRDWQQALNQVGPFDDPTHCFGVGVTFAQGHLYRQAAQQLERVHELVPDNYAVRLWLARLYTFNRLPEKALGLIHNVPIPEEAFVEAGIQKLDLLQTEATALFAANRPGDAQQLLQSNLEKDPSNTNLLALIVRISTSFNQYTNAMMAIDRLLQLNPDDPNTLLGKGLMEVQLGHHREAIPALTRVLSVQTNNYSARLLRAIAYLATDQVEEAKDEYERLQKLFPSSNEVNLGLGEIAWRKKDTNSAVKYYKLCLANTSQNSEQAKFLSERIKSLQPESP